MERGEQRISFARQNVFDALTLVRLVHDLNHNTLCILVPTPRTTTHLRMTTCMQPYLDVLAGGDHSVLVSVVFTQ